MKIGAVAATILLYVFVDAKPQNHFLTSTNDNSVRVNSASSYTYRVFGQLNQQIKKFEREAKSSKNSSGGGDDEDEEHVAALGLSSLGAMSSMGFGRNVLSSNPGVPTINGGRGGPGGPTLRALLAPQMGLVNEYGCWCYFQDDVGRGSGEPVDTLDEICRTLHHGYECIIMDHEEANDPCVPWEVPYNSAFGSGYSPFGLNLENLNLECELQNPDNSSCAQKVCKVEGWFVLSYFTYAIFGGGIDATKRHDNGFDPVSTCGAKPIEEEEPPVEEPVEHPPVEHPSEDVEEEPECTENCPIEETRECCGAYPQRFPYKRNEDHDCCVSSTYNPNILMCCNDGSVAIACA